MNTLVLRLLRSVIRRERRPANLAVRRVEAQKLARKSSLWVVLQQCMLHRPFNTTGFNLSGAVWIASEGAGIGRCLDFLREQCRLDLKPFAVAGLRRSHCRLPLKEPAFLLRLTRLHGRLKRRYGPVVAMRSAWSILELRNARELLIRVRPAVFMLHTDYSELSMALALACEACGVPILLFQVNEINLATPEHTISAGVIYQSADPVIWRRYFKEEGPLIVRPANVPKRSLKVENTIRRLGVALNNYVDADRVRRIVSEMVERFRDCEVIVRLHPNSKWVPQGWPGVSRFSNREERLSDFLSACDVVICGNSAVQHEAIHFGIPVIHLGELDDHAFDSLGFVASGKVYGALRLKDVDLDAMRDFYLSMQRHGPVEAAGYQWTAQTDPVSALEKWLVAQIDGEGWSLGSRHQGLH